MRRVVHRDTPDPHLLTLQGRQQLVQRSRLTRHHRRRRAVDGGNRQAVAETLDPCPYRLGGQRDRRHTPTPRQTLTDHPTALSNDPSAVLQGERTGDDGRGYLTLRMTHHRSRHHPERLPEPGQGDHHGPGRGLHHIDPAQTTRQLRPQVPLHERSESVRTLPQRLVEHRQGIGEFQPHTRPLRALPGKHEHRLPRAVRRACDDRRVRLTRSDRSQTRQQGRPIGPHHHRAPLQPRPGAQQCAADGEGGVVGVVLDVCVEAVRQSAQGVLGAGGERQGDDSVRRTGRVGGRRGGGLVGRCGLFEQDVHVGAADAEGGDTGAARVSGLGPGLRRRQQRHRALRPVDVGGGLVDVERAGQYPVPHRHDHLDDAGDARRRLGVPDVRLDRADQERLRGIPVAAVGGHEGLGLDRVAELRAGAVGLDGVHVVRRQAGVGEGLADDALLRGTVGGGEPVGRTVLVHGRTPHHGQHPVPVAPGVGEALDEEHADALGESEAVGGVGERLAAPVGGEPALAAELGEGGGRRHDGDAAGEGHGALALAEGLDGEVQGDQ
ncbi:Uncharacterised protein [Streptomyces griseus]|nr:Uncharacterised protein [Streptomyces griseus]